MARPNKIDQLGLAEKVLSLAATKTTREIARILKDEDGADISHVAVARYIQGIRQERAEATRALVQEAVRATVPRDIEILAEIIDQAYAWYTDPNLKISEKLQVMKPLLQAIEIQLRYSGAGDAGTTVVVNFGEKEN